MKFEPDWASPPGDSILRHMETNNISRDEIAGVLNLDSKGLEHLFKGELRIDGELAMILEKKLGATQEFWKKRDKEYLKDLNRLKMKGESCPIKEWLSNLPITKMKELGVIKNNVTGQCLEKEVYKFFGCKDLLEWNEKYGSGIGAAVAFFKSSDTQSKFPSTIAWLRLGEIQAEGLVLEKFKKKEFRENLIKMKRLSFFKNPEVFWPRLQNWCAKFGVALVSHCTLPGCKASGATWCNNNGNPIIMMSFRYLSDDHFWFTFFHEAAHAVLHSDTHISFDERNLSPIYDSNLENEANQFAENVIIPQEMESELYRLPAEKHRIINFATRAKIAPGVIVGQLQRKRILDFKKMNHLKRRFQWKNCYKVPSYRQR